MSEIFNTFVARAKEFKLYIALGLVALVLAGVLFYLFLPRQEVVNYLVLGFDRFEERDPYYRVYRPDSIFLIAVDYDAQAVKILPVPRDTKMEIAHTGEEDKVNRAYYYGFEYGEGTDYESNHNEGIRYTVDTVAEFVSAPVDYYLEIDMDGFVELVDLLGGITHEVATEINEDLPWGSFHLEPGEQHLDGRELLAYIHYRDIDDPTTDLERKMRQKAVLESAFEQFREEGRISDIPDMYDPISDYVETDIPATQVANLARLGSEISSADIKNYTLEGEYVQVYEDLVFFEVDEASRAAVAREMFGVELDQ